MKSMMMRSLVSVASLALLGACEGEANATGPGTGTPEPAVNAVVSFGSGAAQSFDIDFGSITRVTLAFVTFRDEAAPTMSFSALINNQSGYNFDGLNMRLTGGAVFQSPSGSVTPTFGTLAGTVVTPTQVVMSLSVGEPYALSFGNPLGEVGASDWMIDFSAVESGATFGLSVTAVPEPGTYAMLLAGLGLIGTMVRRRRPS